MSPKRLAVDQIVVKLGKAVEEPRKVKDVA